MLAASDLHAEDYFDIVNKQQGETDRAEVARAGKLAAQYRAQQIRERRMRRAIERRAEERRALKALSGESHDTQQRTALTSATEAVASDQ
jgi:hypothetical protein